MTRMDTDSLLEYLPAVAGGVFSVTLAAFCQRWSKKASPRGMNVGAYETPYMLNLDRTWSISPRFRSSP